MIDREAFPGEVSGRWYCYSEFVLPTAYLMDGPILLMWASFLPVVHSSLIPDAESKMSKIRKSGERPVRDLTEDFPRPICHLRTAQIFPRAVATGYCPFVVGIEALLELFKLIQGC